MASGEQTHIMLVWQKLKALKKLYLDKVSPRTDPSNLGIL